MIPVQRVQSLLKIAQQPLSLQTPTGDDDDYNLGDFIPDGTAPRHRKARMALSSRRSWHACSAA